MTGEVRHKYDNPFYHDNVYGHAYELLRRHCPARAEGRLHLDLGCAFGRIAEPLREHFGLHYIGCDGDREGLASLDARGFETHQLILGTDEEETFGRLSAIVAGRGVGSVTMLDTLEHLTEQQGSATLRALRRVVAAHNTFLVISVPNVTHADVGFRLAFGDWTYTGAGLLDHTHLRFFGPDGLRLVLEAEGLYAVDRLDVRFRSSDQHFPKDHPALARGTMLHEMLDGLRDKVNDYGDVIQFVRLCTAGPFAIAAPFIASRVEQRPFLSVVTRTQGNRLHTLREVLLCLSAQTDRDFELLVVGHKVAEALQYDIRRAIEDCPTWLREKTRFIRVDKGNRTHPINVGFEAARGEYIAILDDDDAVMAHWVETFRDLARQAPGRLLRTVTARQSVRSIQTVHGAGLRAEAAPFIRYARSFDHLQHLRCNDSPPVTLAFPRGVFHDFRLRFDEDLTTTEDWDYMMRVAAIVGVASSTKVTSIYRWWEMGESSRSVHSDEEWRLNHARILHKMDAAPILLPPGTTARLRYLMDAHDRDETIRRNRVVETEVRQEAATPQADARIEKLRLIHAMLASTSWRVSAPIRWVGRVAGKTQMDADLPWTLSNDGLDLLIARIRASTSWRLSRPVRRLRGYRET